MKSATVVKSLAAVFAVAAVGSCSVMAYQNHKDWEARNAEAARKEAALTPHVFYSPDQYKDAIQEMNKVQGTGCVFSFNYRSGKTWRTANWVYNDFKKLGDCADLAQRIAIQKSFSSYRFSLKGDQPDQYYALGQCGWRNEPAKKPYCYAKTYSDRYWIEVR